MLVSFANVMIKSFSIYLSLILIIVFWGGASLFAQQNLLTTVEDTIDLDYRSRGVELDSIDASFIGTLNLRPGAGDSRLMEHHLARAFGNQMNGLSYRMNKFRVRPVWTGLPYLGFQYAFGSSLNQAMNVDFHQYFRSNTHLHFNYYRRTSNGFLRNSDFTLNDVSLLFVHSKGKYATEIDAYYGADERGENEGIVSDDPIPQFPMEFVEVQNNTARSKVRLLDVKWKNYFRLIGDSVVGTGFISRHNYELTGREYTSRVNNILDLDTVYIDSFDTRDQYQTASLSNGAGVFFNAKNVSVDAALNHRYWRNQNLGVNRDTNEAFLDANAYLRLNENMDLNSYFYFNFLGAIGELKSRSKIEFNLSEKLEMDAHLNFENMYPDPYLRHNTTNYYSWNIPADQLQLQQSLNLGGNVKFGKRQHILTSVNWTSINNGRYFIDGEWRQDTLDLISVGSVGVKGQVKLGGWSFYPGVEVRFQSSNFNYQPTLSTHNRITYSTKIFSNNLGIAIGADIGYDTGYSFLNYNGVLGVMSPFNSFIAAPSLLRLNAFTALSVDEFRFFVRAENIDYFINDPKSRIDEDYTIMPFLIRIGITWDFFN